MKKTISTSKNVKELSNEELKHIEGGKAPLCPYPTEAMYNPETGNWSCC
ncbi:class IIb bacteriocin, lactobin A/cerein 7B family [Aquimarina addita]